MLHRIRKRVKFIAVTQQVPSILDNLHAVAFLQLLCSLCAEILERVLSNLCWVESVVGHSQHISVILLLANQQLSKIDRSCDTRSIAVIYSHPVEIPIVVDPQHVIQAWLISEKTHALQPSVSEGLINWNHQLITSELIKDRSQQIHTCIFPEATFDCQDLMSHYVCNCGQFVIWTASTEVEQIDYQLVGLREVLSCDVLLSPQFDLIVWIEHLCFTQEVLFGRWQFISAQPHLMDNSRNKLRPCLVLYRHKFVSIVEGNHLAEWYLPLENILHTLIDFFALQSSFGILHLFLVYFFQLLHSDSRTLQHNHLPWHIPHTAMFLHQVEHPRLVDLASYHFKQRHQENQAVVEVLAVDVSQIELWNITEALDCEYSHVVYY